MDSKEVVRRGLAVSAIFSIVLVLDKFSFHGSISTFLGDDIFKLLLQFFLIATTGGLIILYMNMLKEQDAKTDLENKDQREHALETAAVKRELAQELDKMYRQSKRAKRLLRSHINATGHDGRFAKAAFFEARMTEITETQLSVEQMRERIRISTDLFADDVRENLILAINYSARYLHEVFQDFEKGRTILTKLQYEIAPDCLSLKDFLDPIDTPPVLQPLLDKMEDTKADITERWSAFKQIEALRKSVPPVPRRARFKVISEACFEICAEEIRLSVRPPAAPAATTSAPLVVPGSVPAIAGTATSPAAAPGG